MLEAAWKLIGVRGAIGIVLGLILSALLVVQKGETRHWHKLSDGYETQLRLEQAALAETVANYRAAADQARDADAANATRVKGEQSQINQERDDAYQARIAAARARADSLRAHAEAAANSSGSGAASVPGVSAAAGGSAQAAGQAGLPLTDALTATEQAIQLDELIKWVRKQAGVDVNGPAPTAQGKKP